MENLTRFKPGDRVRILDVDFVLEEFRGLTGTVVEVFSDRLIRFEIDETPNGWDEETFTGSPDCFEHYSQEVDAELSASIERFIEEF